MNLNLLKSVYSHRLFIWEMAKRDLIATNKGAMLGYLWLVLNPLIQTAAYVFIVSFIFGTKLGDGSGPFDYAIYVMSGMVPWQIMTKALTDAPMLIRQRMELVKQVIYPVETLPIGNLILASFGSSITLGIFLVLSITTGTLSITSILLPIPILLTLLMLLGYSWLFSIVGVILKDISQIMSILLGLMVYASPVIVREEAVSPAIWKVIQFNPLSHIVICFRDVYFNQWHPVSWGIFIVLTLIALLSGGWLLNKVKVRINEYI